MSINLTDKLDEAIAELKKEEAIKQKNFRSAIAKECWATSKKLQAKMFFFLIFLKVLHHPFLAF